MDQVTYISTVAPNASVSTDAILRVSRRNNARDQITGLLFFNGQRFLQALEGPTEAVARAMARIGDDPRHRALVILSKRVVAEREFGGWAMADAATADEAATLDRVATLVAAASPNIRATFNSYARVRRAA